MPINIIFIDHANFSNRELMRYNFSALHPKFRNDSSHSCALFTRKNSMTSVITFLTEYGKGFFFFFFGRELKYTAVILVVEWITKRFLITTVKIDMWLTLMSWNLNDCASC